MKNKIHFERLSFNITNHCNLNCPGCYTLSNYNLIGHQTWANFQDDFLRWSEKIDLDSWVVYGGEPLINPDYLNWLDGILELWPNSTGKISTNGYPINKNRTLYNYLVSKNGKIEIDISLHNISKLEEMLNRIESFLANIKEITRYPDLDHIPNSRENWIKSYNNIRGSDWPDCQSWNNFNLLPDHIKKECIEIFNFSDTIFKDNLQGYKFVDDNGIVVVLNKVHWHSRGPLLPQDDLKTFKLHSSDPVKAHNSCSSRLCKEFFNGKLHKCNTSAHFEDFEKQYNIELTEQERDILYDYNPCPSTASLDEIKIWIENANYEIPQCRFCSETLVMEEIYSDTKKIFFKKKD